MSETLLLGAHMSASGGVHNALFEGDKIGATTIQLFTRNQRRWGAKPFTAEEIALWKDAYEKSPIEKVMSHDSYLINLGSPKEEGLEKSRRAFFDEIKRCLDLGITYLNFHPGAALDESEESCLDRICESLLLCEEMLDGKSTRLLLETTAGQGSCVGYSFEQLGYIVERVKDSVPIGVCIDTCHIFAAGYDLCSEEACDQMLKEFDRVVGLEHLYAFHLNDSLKRCGSRVDRHQPLGKGEIGMPCFTFLLNDPRTRALPKYLETPGGPDLWVNEIALMRQLAGETDA